MIKEVKIELTEHCERECIYCSSKAQKVQFQYLDETLVKRIIHEATLLKHEVLYLQVEKQHYIQNYQM